MARIERGVGVLEHHLQLAAQFGLSPIGQPRKPLAGKIDRRRPKPPTGRPRISRASIFRSRILRRGRGFHRLRARSKHRRERPLDWRRRRSACSILRRAAALRRRRRRERSATPPRSGGMCWNLGVIEAAAHAARAGGEGRRILFAATRPRDRAARSIDAASNRKTQGRQGTRDRVEPMGVLAHDADWERSA